MDAFRVVEIITSSSSFEEAKKALFEAALTELEKEHAELSITKRTMPGAEFVDGPLQGIEDRITTLRKANNGGPNDSE